MPNSFGTLRKLNDATWFHSLPALGDALGVPLDRMPVSLKVLLENLVRHEDDVTVTRDDIAALARWPDPAALGREVTFYPFRVLMPDSSGIPLLIDLAALRDAMVARGLDPRRVNPVVPTDLVIDHSVRVDFAGTPDAFARNLDAELERNRERFGVVRWAMAQFANLRVVPPGNGIIHQINIEHLAQVVACAERDGRRLAFPDSLVGMDSHTPMVNGLGVFGWGVGGIEAAIAMFGQPLGLPMPRVVGCRLVGAPRTGVMCTDIVLALTRFLRGADVLAAVVEFCGPALEHLSAAGPHHHRQHGGRVRRDHGFLPRRRARRCGISRRPAAPLRWSISSSATPRRRACGARTSRSSTTVLEFDLGSVEPSLAGPSRPESLVRARRRAGDVPQRVCGTRRGDSRSAAGHVGVAAAAARRHRRRLDRLVHQHGEPLSDDRGRAACPERRGQGTADQALDQDVVLAGIARRSGDAREGRAFGCARCPRLPSRRVRLHGLRQRVRRARR